MSLQGKHIVLGITGSIAAYKSATLIRLLIKMGAEVQVVITPSGKEFITPLTLSTLTQKPVVSEFFDRRDGSWHSHVSLGLWADLMLIAPASAATLAKMVTGVADNMLLTTYLSMKAPVWVAPAMDLDMYHHPATQSNLQTLRERGVHVVEPGDGFLASGLEGKGRMEEPEQIVQAVADFFEAKEPGCKEPSLVGMEVLITAGPPTSRLMLFVLSGITPPDEWDMHSLLSALAEEPKFISSPAPPLCPILKGCMWREYQRPARC